MSNHIEAQVKVNIRDLSTEGREASHVCLVEVQVSEQQPGGKQFSKQEDLQTCREPTAIRSPAEKADDLINAAGRRAFHFISDRKERATYVHDLQEKAVGIAEGIDSGVNRTKDFLSRPNAINQLIVDDSKKAATEIGAFLHSPKKEFTAAVNTVLAANDGYTHASPRDQGRIIGEVMLGAAVPVASCELPQVKLMTRRLTGAGGDWHVLNERPSIYAVQQADKMSCVAACGEMLSDGAVDQTTLIEKVGAPAQPERLAKVLGPEWKAECVYPTQANHVIESLPSRGSWAAELRSVPALSVSYRCTHTGHLVVVDGLDRDGNIMIRDPWEGTRYEMTRQDFMNAWTGRAVFRN
jgi:hypothetical protein